MSGTNTLSIGGANRASMASPVAAGGGVRGPGVHNSSFLVNRYDMTSMARGRGGGRGGGPFGNNYSLLAITAGTKSTVRGRGRGPFIQNYFFSAIRSRMASIVRGGGRVNTPGTVPTFVAGGVVPSSLNYLLLPVRANMESTVVGGFRGSTGQTYFFLAIIAGMSLALTVVTIGGGLHPKTSENISKTLRRD